MKGQTVCGGIVLTIQGEKNYIDTFLDYTADLLRQPLVQSMTQYRHHRVIDTHYHSTFVAYRVLKLCEAFNIGEESRAIVRASLLHDFYLYEWYTEKHEENHIYYHPKASVRNIEAHLGHLSEMQRNMILSHMFPLNRVAPHCVGAWLLILADKQCASEDYLHISERFRPVYNEINRRAAL